MKVLKHIVKGALWTIMTIYFMAVGAVHIPFIQQWIGTETGYILSKKFGTEVKISNVNFGFLNRIVIDDLTIYDQKHELMIGSSRLAAKIDYYELIKNGCISISSAQIFGFKGFFYKQDEQTNANYQFLVDSLSSRDTTKKTRMNLSINSLIIRHGALKYNRRDLPFTPLCFNINHLDVSNISAHIIISQYSKENVEMAVKKLSLQEQSGFRLRNLSFDMTIDNNHAEISELILTLPASKVIIPELKATYRKNGNHIIKNSISFYGAVKQTSIMPSDIAYFFPILKNNDSPIIIDADFHGDSQAVVVNHFNLSSFGNGINISAKGNIKNIGNKPILDFDFNRIDCNLIRLSDALNRIHCLNFKLPNIMKKINTVSYKGVVKVRSGMIEAEGSFVTGIGDVNVRATKNGQHFNIYVKTDGINIKELLPHNMFGTFEAQANIAGEQTKDGIDNITIEGAIPLFDYNNYPYHNITVKGEYKNQVIDCTLDMDDSNGQVKINGKMNTGLDKREATIALFVRNLDPAKMKLLDRWKGYRFSFDAKTNTSTILTESGIFKGNVSLNKFTMSSANDTYTLEKLNILANKGNILMQSDFGCAEIKGQYDAKTLLSSFKNLLNTKFSSLCDISERTDNCFKLKAEFNKSDWLNHLFNIPIHLTSPLKINVDVDDHRHELNMLCTSGSFTYNGNPYENLYITAETPHDTLTVNGRIGKIMNNGHKLDLDFTTIAYNDRLHTSISWNNHQKELMAGTLNAVTNFVRGNKEHPDILINVKPSEILVKDTVWRVLPASIKYSDGTLEVDNFSIEHDRQHIKIYGLATKSLTDSITVDLQDVDVNYVLNLVNFHSVDFNGYATGKAYIKSVFFAPDLYADLKVSQFKFENGRMGVLLANVRWNKTDKQIDIDAHADENNGGRTVISGYVSPYNNSIDLGIKANGTNAEFIEGFCGAFMDEVAAKAEGEVRVHGPLNAINLTGQLVVNGSLRIKPLNVTYTLNNDTVNFFPNNIMLRSDTVYDKNGNRGLVNGTLHHKNLTRLTYGLNIKADNLLCYDSHSYGSNTFYGTVYGTGSCAIKGGNGRIDIDVDVKPEHGSFIEYDAASPEAIADQQFITWQDKTSVMNVTAEQDTNVVTINSDFEKKTVMDIPSDMRINFLIDATQDATLHVLMDKTTGDYIALNGTGSLRATYFNKGSFDMFGTYFVQKGIYKLTIQNIVKKEFQFQNGSTIVFGGDPYDASLSLKALYTVKSVPLSDLQIGNSFANNNIRVDCIMNIAGTPKQPHVEFDIDMPTVNNDAAQMVRTVINGEEEMNQQVVYLLGVGRFYVPKNNSSTGDKGRQTQTSLAMQSLLSGTISQQINSVLGNLIKNNNWTFGANISTGDEGFNNAEYEGLLSGHLLNNRLLINGQFGYRDNANATTSFIGDFDINYLLLPSGSIALKVYNQTNDRYFTKSSLNTQGIGLIMKKDFNSLMELFGIKKKKKMLFQRNTQ